MVQMNILNIFEIIGFGLSDLNNSLGSNIF